MSNFRQLTDTLQLRRNNESPALWPDANNYLGNFRIPATYQCGDQAVAPYKSTVDHRSAGRLAIGEIANQIFFSQIWLGRSHVQMEVPIFFDDVRRSFSQRVHTAHNVTGNMIWED